MIIVNGETDEHLDMLEGGVIRQLLDDKWKTFARVSVLADMKLWCYFFHFDLRHPFMNVQAMQFYPLVIELLLSGVAILTHWKHTMRL